MPSCFARILNFSMSHSFRIRFIQSPTDTIQSEANELLLQAVDEKLKITLNNLKPEQPIKDAEQLSLSGHGYGSSQEALEAGQEYLQALTIALAHVRVGADFGHRTAKGVYTNEGVNWLEQEMGKRVLNNTHGLMVFSTNPKPNFVSINAKFIRGTNADAFKAVLLKVIAKRPLLSEREQLAYSLFNSSFFQPGTDSRFMLLVMAIEALIEPEARSTEVQKHVEKLLDQTRQSNLEKNEIASLVGSLRWLLQESINQAGKRLVMSRLGDREYNNMSANKFFSHVYKMRNDLAHGNLPYPSFEDVGHICASLEVFVSDLLTCPIID